MRTTSNRSSTCRRQRRARPAISSTVAREQVPRVQHVLVQRGITGRPPGHAGGQVGTKVPEAAEHVVRWPDQNPEAPKLTQAAKITASRIGRVRSWQRRIRTSTAHATTMKNGVSWWLDGGEGDDGHDRTGHGDPLAPARGHGRHVARQRMVEPETLQDRRGCQRQAGQLEAARGAGLPVTGRAGAGCPVGRLLAEVGDQQREEEQVQQVVERLGREVVLADPVAHGEDEQRQPLGPPGGVQPLDDQAHRHQRQQVDGHRPELSTGIRFVLPTTCSMNATTSKNPGQLK